MTNTILIVNAATGERVQRERNAEEQAQHDADVAAVAAAEKESAAADKAKIAAHKSAVKKWAALGLNCLEVQAIIGGI